MKKFYMKRLILLIYFLSSVDTQGFNLIYNGNDPYLSFELWGSQKERFVEEDYIKDYHHYKFYVEQLVHVDLVNLDISCLSYPYNTLVEIVPFDNTGYYVNSEYVEKLFMANNIVNVIEIGSDYGLSTRHIASQLPENGRLYAVDTWDFTNEAGYHNQRYVPFLSNIVHTGLTDKIIPIKEASQEAIEIFKLLRMQFDMIYVDGDHATDAVLRDLELYYPLLSIHGVICGDDWMLKTVRAGIVQFAQKHNLTIYGGCNFWFLKDEGSYQQKSFLDAAQESWIF